MGKNSGKWKEDVPMRKVLNAINTRPIEELMPVARIVCNTDYAVCFYNNKNHPQFYKNSEKVRKSLRRCVEIGAFDHRETIITMLDLDE